MNEGMLRLIVRAKQRYHYTFILLKQLVISDFKLRYQGSVLGYVWSLLRPLAIFTILYIVFGKVLQIGGEVQYYSVYLLLGIILWNFFVEVTSGSVTAIVGKGDLMRKLNFPRYVIIVAGSLSALINLAINLAIVFVLMRIQHIPLDVSNALIIPLILELYIFSLGVAFLLSSIYVKFRDVGYIWEVVLQAAFYATPIIYPLSRVAAESTRLAKLLSLSPMTQIIQQAREYLVTGQTLTPARVFEGGWLRLVPLAIALILPVACAYYFRSRSRYFAEEA
jgi:ABC-2 type transport system permease protein